jgi:type I restriction enzyme R subunit
MVREDQVPLSKPIDLIDERFGSELTEADQLFFDQIAEAASQNGTLRRVAEVNSLDKFQLVFRQVLETLFTERMELNEELFTAYMSKPDMQDVVAKWLGGKVYDPLSGPQGETVAAERPRPLSRPCAAEP